MDGQIAVAKERYRVGVWRNVIIVNYRLTVDMEAMREIRREIERMPARHGEQWYSIIIIESASIRSIPADVRAESEAQSRDFPHQGSAVVIEGTGFKAAAIRTLIAGVQLVARMRHARRIFESSAAAAEWLSRDCLRLTVADAAALRRFIDDLRAAP